MGRKACLEHIKSSVHAGWNVKDAVHIIVAKLALLKG